MPSREVATIRSLERDSQACKIARSGDNVTVNLQGIENNHVTAGGVLCHPDFPVRVSNHLELKILVLDIKIPILSGSQVSLFVEIIFIYSVVMLFRSLLAQSLLKFAVGITHTPRKRGCNSCEDIVTARSKDWEGYQEVPKVYISKAKRSS